MCTHTSAAIIGASPTGLRRGRMIHNKCDHAILHVPLTTRHATGISSGIDPQHARPPAGAALANRQRLDERWRHVRHVPPSSDAFATGNELPGALAGIGLRRVGGLP